MRKRMNFSFAVPMIVLQILIIGCSYPSLVGKYKVQLQYSSEQSVSQAVSFLESYIQNMKYLAEMVENSWEIQETLSGEDFRKKRSYGSQYDDFYRLNKVFGTYEFSNSIYRFILYVPDNLVYSINSYYFYGESRLEELGVYQRMQEQLSQKKNYLAYSLERKDMNYPETYEMLTIYHQISSKVNGENIGVCSISVAVDEFRKVMENADITTNGIVYLLNEDGKMIVNSNPELYSGMEKENTYLKNGELMTFASVTIDNAGYYVNRQDVGEDGWQMVSLIPVQEYEERYRFFAIQMVLSGLIMAIAIVTVSYFLSGYYVGRLTKLRQKMTDMQGGNLNVQLPLSTQGDEIEEVYKDFNFMVNEVKRLLQEHYQLGKNVKIAEIRALQAQINPHFLYNTLDLINWTAMDYGASDIENIAWNLARFYRLSLNHGKSVISIEEEVEHTQVYVNIENYHFDNAIQFSVDVAKELKHLACLNIILQPFVENAIMHGIAEIHSITQCSIYVSVKQDGDDILFYVQDDGPGMTEEQMEDAVSVDLNQSRNGYGIKNINFRIKLCFGEKYGVHYESRLGEGTTAIIRIPVLTIEEAVETVMIQ